MRVNIIRSRCFHTIWSVGCCEKRTLFSVYFRNLKGKVLQDLRYEANVHLFSLRLKGQAGWLFHLLESICQKQTSRLQSPNGAELIQQEVICRGVSTGRFFPGVGPCGLAPGSRPGFTLLLLHRKAHGPGPRLLSPGCVLLFGRATRMLSGVGPKLRESFERHGHRISGVLRLLHRI